MINQSETRNWFTIWRYLGGMQYPSVRRWCLVLSYLPNVLGCLQVDSTSIANSQGTSKCTCPGKNMPLAMGLPTKKTCCWIWGSQVRTGNSKELIMSENNITLLVSRKSHQRYIYKQCTLIRINSHTHISLLLTIIILLQLLLLWLLLLLLDIIIYYTTVLHIYIYIHQLYFPSELWITKWHLHLLASILANSWVISAVGRSCHYWNVRANCIKDPQH